MGEGGVPKILLERGDNSEQEGVNVEMGGGGCHFFITLQFNRIYCVCGEKVKFVLLHFDSSFFNHTRFSSKSL